MDSRLEKLAHLLVNYSCKVKPGDFVIVEADEVAVPWIQAVVKEALLAGGHVETRISSESVSEVVMKYANEEQLARESEIMQLISEKADVLISAWGGRNTRMNANVPSERMKMRVKSSTKWREVFSRRMGDGSLRWCGTQYPTHSDAQEANMSLSDYEDFVYGAGLMDMADPMAEWKRISEAQDRWVKYLDGKSELHIVSEGTDITVDVTGRKWINCDGHVNFPDGEVFTSPVDTRINGHITFSFPGIYAGKEIEGIRMTVQDGLVVEATAEKGDELLQALLDTDAGARRFGEVAIGTNYGINRFTRNMLFDEKIGGTVHMAIGDSMPEAGGTNQSVVHWDMLCDMRNGGRIYADGELFYENGQFLEAVLK